MLDLGSVNYGAVLLATVASFMWGYVWYYTFFGKIWMKSLGLKPEDIATSGISTGKAMTGSILASLGHAVGVAVLFASLQPTLLSGIFIVLLIWLVFSLSPMFKMIFWEDRPIPLLLIDGGYELVSILTAALIFIFWP